MNFQPPAPSAGQLSISRVWQCASCGHLAQSDISSAACPNCGHIGQDGNNLGYRFSSGEQQSDAQGKVLDSMLSETTEDAKPFVPQSPDLHTLFIPAVEESGNVMVTINSHLSADFRVSFGGFPDNLSGTTAVGYIIKAPRPLTKQEITDLEISLNSVPKDNFAMDNNLRNSPSRSHNLVGMPASASATHGSKAEQQDDWEIVNHSSNNIKELLTTAPKEMLAPDVKSSDAKALEPLDTRYIKITKPQRFFKVGRVFMTLWSEPASSTARDGPNFSSSTVGGRIFSETRRFVVVRSGHGYALCCPIQTYQKRGTTKSRINIENHALVYASGSKPKLLPDEESTGIDSFPIVIEDKFVTVDQSSRLNFGKVYTVEHNIKVRNIGKIDKESLPKLKAALVKSMGVSVSDGEEAETGTETEDNVPRPTPVENQPSLYDKTSSSQGAKSSLSKETKISISSGSLNTSSSGHKTSSRKSTFFIKESGIDREVITADICRYLGNDALVRPGVHRDPKTGKSEEGFYITAYRPPTSSQLADLRADSEKWQKERRARSQAMSMPSSRGDVKVALREEAIMSYLASEDPLLVRHAATIPASTSPGGISIPKTPLLFDYLSPPRLPYSYTRGDVQRPGYTVAPDSTAAFRNYPTSTDLPAIGSHLYPPSEYPNNSKPAADDDFYYPDEVDLDEEML